jgi:hypothetical protein
MKNKTNCKIQTISFLFLCVIVLVPMLGRTVRAGENGWTKLGADAWHNSDKWDVAGDSMLKQDNNRRNGTKGKCPSLVTKRRDYRDVEVHLEFMVAKGSNSGVIFHGNYEIQILDSYGVKKPTAGHCGGVYPRAESKPTYHHIDKGSPPRVNATKQPGEWQTMDIIFKAPRFDENGKKTAHARFVKVVHNGKVIQEDVEVPYASGTNWNRRQYPQGPIIIQGDYGPIAVRNVHIKEWKADQQKKLNVPPKGFTALFNGKDFTRWRMSPKAKKMWSIEDGVLKSHGLLKEWGADLATEKEYRDFVLMVDFRMPTISDSGINFRGLIPKMGNFGQTEQFNLRSKGGMGHLESFYFIPEHIKKNMGLKEKDLPHVKYIDPEVGLWHTVKLTVIGKNVTAEYDGEVILDKFEYPEGILSTEPAIIRFQKHVFVNGDNLGEMNPCPIEYRNIFIKEIELGAVDGQAKPRRSEAEEPRPLNSTYAKLLSAIDRDNLPKGHIPGKHQDYVDRRIAGLSAGQRAKIGQLWKEKQRLDPNIENRGASFVKILEYVAADSQQQQKSKGTNDTRPRTDTAKKPRRRLVCSLKTDPVLVRV